MQPGEPLRAVLLPDPAPAAGQVLLRVEACGVCRTDLHLMDGEVAAACTVVPGHEVVGRVAGLGPDVTRWRIGDRVGAGWLVGRLAGWPAGACGQCGACAPGNENLCDSIRFNGCDCSVYLRVH